MKKLLMLSLIFYVSYIRAYDFEVDGIYYTVTSFDEFLVKVDGFGPSVSGIVNIPSTISYSDKVFTVTEIGSGQSNQITTVLIPPTITKIGGRAFYGSSISSIDIPDNVSDIGAFAFANCINLKSAKITKNISKLQESLFEGCTNLTQVEWHPSSSGKILGKVFWGCSSLRSFRIPAKVSSIGGPEYSAYASDRISAFQNCSSLDSLIIEDGTGAITVRDDHEAAGEQFDSGYHGEFYGSKINYVYMGRPIELYSWASYEPVLRYVEHLVIGDNVENPTWLPNGLGWSDRKTLKTLVIGRSVKNVGSIGNETLEYIKLRSSIPPTAVGFTNYNYINTILYVPKGTKAVYASSDIWKNFWNIQEYEVDGEIVDIKKCEPPTISYSNGKLNFACETEDVTCQTSITDADIKSYSGNEIQLGVTYIINVYATKPGYENSDVVTATLCWIDTEPKTEGISNDIAQVRANAVLIQTRDGQISISGADDGTKIFIYGVNGLQVGSTTSRNGHANITTNLRSGNIAIIKIGDRSVKVAIK